jgi:hypothetical protein
MVPVEGCVIACLIALIAGILIGGNLSRPRIYPHEW